MPIGVIGHVGAGFHVIDAWPEYAVAFAAPAKHVVQHANRVLCGAMTEDQAPWLIATPRSTGGQNVAEAVTSWCPVDFGPDRLHVGFNFIHHPINRFAVI